MLKVGEEIEIIKNSNSGEVCVYCKWWKYFVIMRRMCCGRNRKATSLWHQTITMVNDEGGKTTTHWDPYNLIKISLTESSDEMKKDKEAGKNSL